MNRKQRRKLQVQGTIPLFDPSTTFKLKLDLHVPGGVLRGEYPAEYASTIVAASEVDLLRTAVAQLLQSFGFVSHVRVTAGALASVINPLPKQIRGLIAYAIIQGQGLAFGTDEQEVCKMCGAEKQMTLAPPEEQIDVLNIGIEEDPDPVMRDSTEHKSNCMGTVYEYVSTPVITILMPQQFEPLQQPTDEAEMPEAPTLKEDNPDDYKFTTNEVCNCIGCIRPSHLEGRIVDEHPTTGDAPSEPTSDA